MEGLLEGDAARSTPNVAKLKAPITIPEIRIGTLEIEASVSRIPNRTGTTDRHVPKTRPLITSPASIARSDTGVEIRRSQVLARRSQGVTRGPTADAVNHRVMAIIPGTMFSAAIGRPILNAR